MRNRLAICLLVIGFLGLLMGYAGAEQSSEAAPRVSKEKLKSWMDSHDLVVIDVRLKDQWETSPYKIKGAVYEEPKKLEQWASKYSKSKRMVLY